MTTTNLTTTTARMIALIVLDQNGYTPNANGKVPGLFLDLDGDAMLADLDLCTAIVTAAGPDAFRRLVNDSTAIHG